MRDNSPMFQHWEEPTNGGSGPEGTAEGSRAVSAVPSGLDDLGTDQPNVETLGYCRMSLRDKVSVDCLSPFFGLKIVMALELHLCAPMPRGFVPHPGGMRDNSPMFQHWEERVKWRPSPEGTAERSRAVSLSIV